MRRDGGNATERKAVKSRTIATGLSALMLAATALIANAGGASASGPVTLEATYTSVSNGWAKVERWYDSNPGYVPAEYPADGRLDQAGQRLTHFGGAARPVAGRYLLSYAPGWDTNSKPVPVLLVPGAYETADSAWANPTDGPIGCGATTCPTTGLMQALSGAGYKVFGITFPHVAGDNYNHAEQIGDAIQTIKARTGASKVDVLAWSMGALAARLYVSNNHQSWGTAYGGDVRKLILMGGPNNGWDYTFRHGTYPAISAYPECGGSTIGGVAAIRQNCYGVLYSHPELTAYATSTGDFFPGIRQMLKRWDGTYALNPANPDGNTTYNGGTGIYGQSYGIDYAINQGSLIATMRANAVPASVNTYLLCGNSPTIPNWINETDGPSDGTIFLASCRDTGGIGTVSGSATLAVNHLRLPWASTSVTQITSWLG
ncbi:esterase/lipase family protein [Spirillospora sp. CA-255316]